MINVMEIINYIYYLILLYLFVYLNIKYIFNTHLEI